MGDKLFQNIELKRQTDENWLRKYWQFIFLYSSTGIIVKYSNTIKIGGGGRRGRNYPKNNKQENFRAKDTDICP